MVEAVSENVLRPAGFPVLRDSVRERSPSAQTSAEKLRFTSVIRSVAR